MGAAAAFRPLLADVSDRPSPPRWTEHAVIRLLERYGIVATDEQWMEVWMSILDTVAGPTPRAIMTAREPSGRERWLTSLAGQDVSVIYDANAALIVSVVPRRRYTRR